jgi:predicted nucleotidyltransferase
LTSPLLAVTIAVMDEPRLPIDTDAIAVLARRWGIRELSLFGSVLREDFRDDSDVDVLVQFVPEVQHSLFDLAELKQSLEELFHRPVDLVEKGSLGNPFRRNHILQTARVLYAA